MTERDQVWILALTTALSVLLFGAPVCASDGVALFQQKCSMCHGADGKGDGPLAAALKPPPKDFANPEFWKPTMTDQKIAETIRKGHSDMPPMDQNPADIEALVRYLTTTFKPK
jgi:mono/diheme cytochrome c family protein